MKKYLIMIVVVFLFIAMSPAYALAISNIDENTDEESMEVAVEDMPFVKTDKVKVTSRRFTTKSTYLIQWEQFPGADGYEFKICVNKSFKKKYKPSYAEIEENQMQVNKVKKKYTYYYKIRAFKQNDNGYEYSKWTKAYKIKRKK